MSEHEQEHDHGQHAQDEQEVHDQEHHDHEHEVVDHEGADGHEHDHHGHDHDHDHGDHDHSLIVDRLPAGLWTVDASSSEVNFRTRSMWIIPVNGYFKRFSGELQVDQDGHAKGNLVVETTTLATGINRRDEHLRTADFFHVTQHPHMVFALEKLEPTGEDHLQLSGSLTIRDRSIPLSFPVYAIRHGDHLHIEGRAQIDHRQAGLGWAKPGLVGSKVRADVALTLHQS